MYNQILKPSLEKSHAIINHVNTSTRQHVNTSKNSVRTFTRLSSSFSCALLCAGMLLTSLEVGAADIDCSTDLAVGTLSGTASYAGSLYGSCIYSGGSPPNLGFVETGGVVYSGQQATATPAAPTPARDLGTFSSNRIVDTMGVTPTFAFCKTATYSTGGVPAVANHCYCAKFSGSTATGYMFAKWTGTALSISATACAGGVSTPPTNAPIDLHFSKQVETFATEIEIK